MTYDPKLVKLTEPFPAVFVKDDGRGNDYIPHHIINQRLIQVFGRPPRIEILREVYDDGKLTGVVMRMTVPGFDPVEEGGEADNPQSKTNGARLKDACSDALKRCAMRLGCGLHLWAQGNYYLHDKILQTITEDSAGSAQAEPTASVPERPKGESADADESGDRPSPRVGSNPIAAAAPSTSGADGEPSTGGSPPSDAGQLLTRWSWEQIKPVAREVCISKHPGAGVPLKVEHLANCEPQVIQDIAAELETRLPA